MRRQSSGMLAVALVSAAGGFLLYRQYQASTATVTAAPAATTVAVATPPAAPAETATGKAAIPETVPDISLQDVSGKLRTLKEFSGQPTIINFWATWCAPCRREIPLLNELQRAHGPSQLRVIGIAVDFRDAVKTFLQTTRLDYPLLIGEQDGVDAAARFGMELVLPFSIFVDGRERIVAVKVGELHRDEADAILAAIADLSAGKRDLPATRLTIADQLRALSAERALQAAKTGAS